MVNEAIMTLTILLPIKMVIKSGRGSDSNFSTRFDEIASSDSNNVFVFLSIEKYAVSEPEKNADNISKKGKLICINRSDKLGSNENSN